MAMHSIGRPRQQAQPCSGPWLPHDKGSRTIVMTKKHSDRCQRPLASDRDTSFLIFPSELGAFTTFSELDRHFNCILSTERQTHQDCPAARARLTPALSRQPEAIAAGGQQSQQSGASSFFSLSSKTRTRATHASDDQSRLISTSRCIRLDVIHEKTFVGVITRRVLNFAGRTSAPLL